MEVSRKLRELRQRDGLSQEALAKRIYVSRQTVSSWETGKCYPDIQSLLLLGTLFDVSLDELVKGDIPVMKNELERYRFNLWGIIMIVSLTMAGISIPLVMPLFNGVGVVIPVMFEVIMFIAAFKIGFINKRNDLRSFSEVIAFSEGNADPHNYQAWGRRHRILYGICVGVGGFILSYCVVKAAHVVVRMIGS